MGSVSVQKEAKECNGTFSEPEKENPRQPTGSPQKAQGPN